jgi:alanine dehydrogenase
MAEDAGLMKGLNTYRGQVTYEAVADYFGLPFAAYEA